MKLDFRKPENQRQIESVRSQIKKAEDLRKFDEFIAKNDSFDFNNAANVAEARACCGGDQCCKIVIELDVSAV
ncbi:MAG: hypothetical protein WCY25_06740 [Moheibacter sp.]